ncbi:MAG: metallo-mystery pair system four-Cys motif protein [Silvanigrellales bacterium]|nr:metallo-mystery pair system four-Cys motif protein [Silvanigrellales bacterium]
MKRHLRLSHSTAVLGIVGLTLGSACSDSSATQVDEPRPFQLEFVATASGQPLRCAQTLSGLGSKKTQGKLLDFAFYVRGLSFIRADGSEVAAELDTNAWQNQNVALLDFQDLSDECKGAAKPTNTIIKGQVPTQDEFSAVRFTVGLPPALNHANPASAKAPFNVQRLFWSWQSGYKSMRLDIAPKGGITRPSDPSFSGTNYFFHLGSTGCTGNPESGRPVKCSRTNQPVVTLSNFEFQKSKVSIDVATLLADLDLNTDAADTPGCMSDVTDTECKAFFKAIGLEFESGAVSQSPQVTFRLL